MYFKRLEIHGFKSFYNKTVLDFEPGVTAVVGPNGCGKSNIFDSIRWVLGEQSVKALRGSDMQDVIFNGTESKEALSMAEVTLVFDNNQRFFPVDHHEVAITRRLFRSGESEYLINKTTVRLKDILDILMGTGIGAESYSLIQQGKIDLVLSSRPEDRRMVFDEASGISKYKAQKRETMRKLEETEQNLLRVNDIVTEVKRQIASLERQANKARRYKEMFEELKSKEVNYAVLQKKSLLAEKDTITRALGEMELREQQLLQQIKDEESRIASRQAELRTLEEKIQQAKNEIFMLESVITRNAERASFNRDRINELVRDVQELEGELEQTRLRAQADEEKLTSVRQEYEGLERAIADKKSALRERESELAAIESSVHGALDQIQSAKRQTLDVLARAAAAKNEITTATSHEGIAIARKKRLELECAKTAEERAGVEANIQSIISELASVEAACASQRAACESARSSIDQERLTLEQINARITELEKQKLALESQKEFLTQLKHKYDNIGESQNAVIYLDTIPTEKLSGMVIRITQDCALTDEDRHLLGSMQLKVRGEAKPIDLDTARITERLGEIDREIATRNTEKAAHESQSQSLHSTMASLQEQLQQLEIQRANRHSLRESIQEQLDKIGRESEILTLELSDIDGEIDSLGKKLSAAQIQLAEFERQHKELEESITLQQNAISESNVRKEGVLIAVAQVKAEIEGLQSRITTDAVTLRLLEETFNQDTETIKRTEAQIAEARDRITHLEQEITELTLKSTQAQESIAGHTAYLQQAQLQFGEISGAIAAVVQGIETNRISLDGLKTELYELQMRNKDNDFKYLSIKERVLQGYKIDLDSLMEVSEPLDESVLVQDIQKLKDKVDAYGTVNLVAIEEYDELKKRYDFLNQQQTDLVGAKDSLHEAILKINRTTRKMFIETFEKVREEFKNYFRLLFNGGDCQIYLIDENDPLESGIEIICRPPGKKLQNILLLSGGEKSMAAIALIFAIFKVKPAPFCVLDEIDAALDEANVDRFGRILQEFTNNSQFIVITHNKKTIANADVMYGITMEESGVSKIVSVKFSHSKKTAEAQEGNPAAVSEPA